MTALLENLEAHHQSYRNFRGAKPLIIYFTGAGAPLASPSPPPLMGPPVEKYVFKNLGERLL